MVDKIKRNFKKIISSLFRKIELWKIEIELFEIEKKLKNCGEGFYIHAPFKIHSPEEISIGNNVKLGSFLLIWGGGGVSIGDDCLIASHVSINSVTHSTETFKVNELNISKPISIGNNVWIASHCVILPGVKIGNNCVIGAGSLVNRDIPDNSIAYGTPAKIIRAKF